MSDEEITVVKVKVFFFKPKKPDPLYGYEVPSPDVLSQWLKDGMDKNTDLSGYLHVGIGHTDTWLIPFGDALYCDHCVSIKKPEDMATNEEDQYIEYGNNYICKTCLEEIKQDDPALYKDLTDLDS